MIFGKKYMGKEFDERGFKAVIEEALQLVATPNIGDDFPYVRALDLQLEFPFSPLSSPSLPTTSGHTLW